MSAIVFKEDFAPVYLFSFQGEASAEEFDAYIASLDRVLTASRSTGRRFLMVFDATHAGSLPAPHRKRMGEWLKTNADDLRRLNVASIFIINSAVVRAILTGILWIQPLPNEYRIVPTLTEGLDVAADLLKVAGIALPAGLQAGLS